MTLWAPGPLLAATHVTIAGLHFGDPDGSGPGHIATPPAILSQPLPEYPDSQLRQPVWGKTVVRFVVDTHGQVQDAVKADSVTPAFEAPAIAGVSKWRFTPGTLDGRPVNTVAQTTIVFKMDPFYDPAEATPPERWYGRGLAPSIRAARVPVYP